MDLVSEITRMRSQGYADAQIIPELQRQGADYPSIYAAMNQSNMSGPGGPIPDQNQSSRGMVDERTHIEEIAEAIIDEKWEDLVKNLNKISEWKDLTDSKLAKLETELKNTQDSFDKLHKAIIGKIGEYDHNILNVGTEIKAMEKVFQKILPSLTENVNELSRITKRAKTSSPK